MQEAGAVVLKNQTLAEMRIEGVSPMDDRKVEILAKNLPLYQGIPSSATPLLYPRSKRTASPDPVPLMNPELPSRTLRTSRLPRILS